MKSKKRILLLNSFAVNNGDLALVLALYDQLIFRGYAVTIATFHYDFLKPRYPDIPFIKELLDYRMIGGTFVKKIFLAINFLFNKTYRDHDVFIASPGGYVNSYYGLKRCLLHLFHGKRLGLKTAIYSQSVGPLNERDKSLLTKFSKSIDVILVRDNYSKEYIDAIPCSSKVLQTKDAAFLLTPRVSKAKADGKTVAVSVREWNHDNRDMKDFCGMIQSFCEIVLKKGYNIEFISTCQGVENYRDDSRVAEVIRQVIVKDQPEFTNQIHVDSAYHTYHELTELLNTKYCFTIGTRLHMCILSLINGTPAFNISYEVKGVECYKYLGWQNYSVDFNESQELAIQKFNDFLENYKTIQENVMAKISAVHEESKETLTRFIKEIGI